MDPFFSNLAVEEVPNYEFLLDDSHFAYVQPLSNYTSSTAKLEKKDPPRTYGIVLVTRCKLDILFYTVYG